MKGPHGLMCQTLAPQMVLLFWEVLEALRGVTESEEVGHWRHAFKARTGPGPFFAISCYPEVSGL